MNTRLPTKIRSKLGISKAIERAFHLQQQGQFFEARRLYEAVLEAHPNHFDALHFLGVLRAQQGHPEVALELISQALRVRPGSAEAHHNFGNALTALHRYDEALACFDSALAINPAYAEALSCRGAALASLGRHGEAVASLDKALTINPDVTTLYNRGTTLQALNRNEEAIENFDRVLAVTPNYASALYNRGNALLALKRYEQAIASYDRALTAIPEYADALNNRGSAFAAIGHVAEAIASFNRAIAARPNYFDALFNRGTALAALNRHGDAIASFDGALAIELDHADVFNNRGNSLQAMYRLAEAIASYDKAIAINPDNDSAYNNRGTALSKLGHYEEAIASFDKALHLAPESAIALNNRANTLQSMHRYEEALLNYTRLLEVDPDFRYALGSVARSKAYLCDWREYRAMTDSVAAAVRAGKQANLPFPFLSISDNPRDQLSCASTFARDEHPAISPALCPEARYAHYRIRVAYLSADFHDHPVAFLMAGLFDRHDKSRFETIAISFSPTVNSQFRKRLEAAFDRFIDVRQKSDAEVAQLLRDLEVDIAVDLMGFTLGARTNILAYRAAPIQVNYLGYPGTMGTDYIDYILADRFLIPEEFQPFYAENVVYLPECYQVNDAKRRIAKHTPTRAEVGLPERGFVFCCFNNCYKLTPEVFDIWMRLLRQVDHSVLWLVQSSDKTNSNLRHGAQARRVDPERLIFAPRIKVEQYLARYRLADLFVDTLPYNAGTTASDALWAGLPVLTCAGKSFVARMAGSLLHAVGLPELVTHSLPDYEALALKLATDPVRLRMIRDKLAANRLRTPLFDTDRFRRHIEAAYTIMWEIHQQGKQPTTFDVAPLSPADSTALSSRFSSPRSRRLLSVTTALARARTLHRESNLPEARRLYEAVLEIQPNEFDALHSLGVLQAQEGDPQKAVELISRALAVKSDSAEAHHNLGNALIALNRHVEALACFDKASQINPGYADAQFNALFSRAALLAKLQRYRDTIASYEKALAINPYNASAHYNKGNALAKLGDHLGALASYDKALANERHHLKALNNRANSLQMLGRDKEAIDAFTRLLKVDPGYKYAMGALLYSRARICDWRDYRSMTDRAVVAVRAGEKASPPFPFLSISDNPNDQLSCANTFAHNEYPAISPVLCLKARYTHDRIRVAYLSADFNEHPVAFLMAGLFEQHDKTRFETTAISFGPVLKSPMRTRLQAAFDRFIDVRRKSDAEVARLLRDLEVDIAVDLMGFTLGARTNILAHRAAPIQVNYLGYPGTMGTDYIDYILADRFLIPEEYQSYYAERVVYLPCYQVNDSKRRITKHTPTRAEAGLPERGFVFCCFNNSYKLTPEVFDLWMRLLRQVEGSVLWLSERNPGTAENLRREAKLRGVDPGRIVFAGRLKNLSDHLARHRLADLFLDTLPYNAHTTASDALWVELPVLTCPGRTFASRVAGSLLHAVGLPELVTHSLQDYEALALALATDPARLREIKQRLAVNRLRTPLFNTDRFRRHLEAAYTTMWQTHQRGESPRSFEVKHGEGE